MIVATVGNNTPFPADFSGGGTLTVYGTLTASGNYVTHGDTMAFLDDRIKSDYPPLWVDVSEAPAAGISASGFRFVFVPGTTQANGVLQVFTGSAAQSASAELSAGAYPAGLTGAVLIFRATFISL